MNDIFIAGSILTNLVLCAWIVLIERRLSKLNYILYSIAIGDATATIVDDSIVFTEEK
jgi:hypothetical protein